MFRNYLNLAVRHLVKYKSFSFINILGLSLGMTVSILLLLWVQDELMYDKFHSQIDNIYQISMVNEQAGSVSGGRTIPYKMVPVLRENYPEVKDAVRYRYTGDLAMQYNGKDYNENNVMLTESNLFSIFDFKLLKGDTETALNDPYSIILSESSARKIFGDEEPMGKVILINSSSPFTVTGILQDVPARSSLRIDYLIPFSILGERADTWSWECSGFVLLHSNVDLADFAPVVRTALVDHSPRDVDVDMLLLQQLSHVHLYSPTDEPAGIKMVYILGAIAFVILIIACINFMNLATARYALRAREVGVRKIAGAARNQVTMQFLAESLFITALAIILAIVLIELFLPEFNNLTGKNISLSLSNKLLIAGFPLVLLFTGIFSGLYPALFLSSYAPIQILRSKFSSDSMKVFRKLLVVFQFAVSIILIIVSFIIFRQINYINHKDLGINTDFVLHLPLHSEHIEKYDIIKEELLKNENIIAITTSTSLPSYVGNVNPVSWEGKPDDERVIFRFYNTDNDFFKIFEIPFTRGGGFTLDTAEPPNIEYIVNEKAVEIMKMDDPVGKKFSMFGNDGYIVGVIEDFHNVSLDEEIRPLLISQLSWFRSILMIKIKPEATAETLKYIETTLEKVCPGFPFSYTFLDETITGMYSETRRTRNIILYFTGLAVFISCLGLFGLSSFMTQKRSKEICLRKILGSNINQLLLKLTGSFLRWVAIASLIAVPVAWYLGNLFLEEFVYHYRPGIFDFLLPVILQFLLAAFTVSFQTIRAAYANPAEALKYE
ncbi:MAG: ABC transporter permease [Candidatus Cloacimonetes bacterium]|nr:ABC transporter permease [Candidatus Cloacimonadota bacterium]